MLYYCFFLVVVSSSRLLPGNNKELFNVVVIVVRFKCRPWPGCMRIRKDYYKSVMNVFVGMWSITDLGYCIWATCDLGAYRLLLVLVTYLTLAVANPGALPSPCTTTLSHQQGTTNRSHVYRKIPTLNCIEHIWPAFPASRWRRPQPVRDSRQVSSAQYLAKRPCVHKPYQ